MGAVIRLDEDTGGSIPSGNRSGEVEFYNDLPDFNTVLNQKWLVLKNQGFRWLGTLKRGGEYIAEAGGWRKISDAQTLFDSSEFAVQKGSDQLRFDLSNFTKNNLVLYGA